MFPLASFKSPPVYRDSDYNNTSDYTPIFLAAHRGYFNLVHSLLQEDSVKKEIHGRTLMHVAAANGHEEIICLLCERNSHVDKGDRDGNTPLHLAIKGYHTDVVNLLLNENNVNLKNSSQETPLHIATTESNIQVVEILLKNGARVDEQDAFGNTALHIAVKKASPIVKIIALLMEHKASVNAACPIKFISLYNAVYSENIEVVKILLKYGTPIDIITESGISPLVLAIRKNNTEIVRLLLNNGYHVNYEVMNNMTPLHYAAECGNKEIVELLMTNGYGTINARNDDFKTPLYFATANGHISILKYLIEQGAKIESKIPEQESPLHMCAINGRIDVLKFLLDHGAKINVRTFLSETPLHLSASNGHLDIVKYLLECGAEIDAETVTNETPLHHAVKAGHVEIVKELLNMKANINSLASAECSALAFAVKSREKEIVQLFLSKGVKESDNYFAEVETALHVAAKNGDEEILKILLKAGCSVNNGHKGKKAIHVAAIFGHRKSVEILIQSGADIHSRTNFGETALHFAAVFGRSPVVKFLLDAGANPKLETNSYLMPLAYVLNRTKHAAISQECSMNSSSKSTCGDSTLKTVWNVSPFMFEKYLEITEMLLTKYDSSLASSNIFTKHPRMVINLLIYAFRITVSNEDQPEITSNTTDLNKSKQYTTGVIFRPEIVRCILNYVINCFSTHDVNSIINIATSRSISQLMKCILEYDVQKSCRDFNLHDSQNSMTTLTVIDHIEDVKTIENLLPFINGEIPKCLKLQGDLKQTRLRLLSDTLYLLVVRLVQIRSASKQSDIRDFKKLEIFIKLNILSELYTDCELQIMNMRETKIHHDFDVSYYDILSQPVNKLANYVRRQELLEILELSYMKFPNYANFLKISVEKGKRRNELIDSSADSLLNVIKKNHKLQLPSLVIDKIFDYLSVIDLLRLSQAGRLLP